MLDANKLYIIKHNKPLLTGHRNRQDGLWDVIIKPANTQVSTQVANAMVPALVPPSLQAANAIIRKDQTKSGLTQYLHACAFSPPISMLQKAIRAGHLITWPGITDINFTKVLKTTLATEQGHLD